MTWHVRASYGRVVLVAAAAAVPAASAFAPVAEEPAAVMLVVVVVAVGPFAAVGRRPFDSSSVVPDEVLSFPSDPLLVTASPAANAAEVRDVVRVDGRLTAFV